MSSSNSESDTEEKKLQRKKVGHQQLKGMHKNRW